MEEKKIELAYKILNQSEGLEFNFFKGGIILLFTSDIKQGKEIRLFDGKNDLVIFECVDDNVWIINEYLEYDEKYNWKTYISLLKSVLIMALV